MSSDIRPGQDPLVGRIVGGRFRVLRKLGEGGMGVVYLAEQVSIGRKVALKILHHKHTRDEEFTKRFHHEARLAASLNHPKIVTIYDFDHEQDGRLFIAMEYVEGRDLRDTLQAGALSVRDAVHLGAQVAEGLEAAHRAGVIHRDMKPENIMVTKDNTDVKIMDFGIANVTNTQGVTRLTRTGELVGTPGYMAPERIEKGQADEKADIYAFGILLYEMLTGDLPFSAQTPAAMMIKHVQEVPPPLRELRADIPSSVERIVMQALEKDPHRRQRSMSEIAHALRTVESPLALVPPTRKAQHRKHKGAAIAVAATLILGTAWMVWVARSPNGLPLKTLVTKLVQTVIGDSQGPAPSLPDPIAALLAQARRQEAANNLTTPAGDNALETYREILQRVPAHKDALAGLQRIREQHIQWGQMAEKRKEWAKAKTNYELALKVDPRDTLLVGVLKKVEEQQVQAHLAVGNAFFDRGQYKKAIAEFEKAKTLQPRNQEILTLLMEAQSAWNIEEEMGTLSQ